MIVSSIAIVEKTMTLIRNPDIARKARLAYYGIGQEQETVVSSDPKKAKAKAKIRSCYSCNELVINKRSNFCPRCFSRISRSHGILVEWTNILKEKKEKFTHRSIVGEPFEKITPKGRRDVMIKSNCVKCGTQFEHQIHRVLNGLSVECEKCRHKESLRRHHIRQRERANARRAKSL